MQHDIWSCVFPNLIDLIDVMCCILYGLSDVSFYFAFASVILPLITFQIEILFGLVPTIGSLGQGSLHVASRTGYQFVPCITSKLHTHELS